MKIKSIKKVGKQKVYDLTVPGPEHYILENGVVSHNTGIYYSANWIFIMGRSQEKEGSGAKAELTGYNFKIKIDKSRFVREGSVIPIYVDFEEGINKWSGMLDLALEMGFVTSPKQGSYARGVIGDEDLNEKGKPWKAKDAMKDEFWEPVFRGTDFADAIKRKYKLSMGEAAMVNDEIEEGDE